MKKSKAFTLLEVLIALVILAISLTALIKATSSNIEDLSQLRARSVAHFLANNTLTKVQIGLVTAPKSPFINELTETAFKTTWKINISSDEPILPGVTPVMITVFQKNKKNPMATLRGVK